jgi:hypothetical protein
VTGEQTVDPVEILVSRTGDEASAVEIGQAVRGEEFTLTFNRTDPAVLTFVLFAVDAVADFARADVSLARPPTTTAPAAVLGGAAIGGIVGAAILMVLTVAGLLFCLRGCKPKQEEPRRVLSQSSLTSEEGVLVRDELIEG